MKENLTKNLKKKKGFTLIELIIVIAILAIIAVIAIPKFGQVQKNAKISSDKTNAKTIANAISKEITDDKITPPSSNTITIDFALPDSASDADKKANNDNIAKVKDSLQSIPTPKYLTEAHFTAIIDTSGNVTINAVGKEGSDTTAKTIQVYPVPAPPYDK